MTFISSDIMGINDFPAYETVKVCRIRKKIKKGVQGLCEAVI